ncbi:hypothetical protein [Pelagicoccus mobilis]|uniref:Uncharacterized protein n=1 Tax=Pelagicoccus mobilis TaxID=415221 RepID=A0A934RZB6_9BACT|nr:hypothetical protein [Pelagicoccus mobilis]MBK1879386.1 hypothetical protein [Pelagicoccus mobilis]
MSTPEQPNPNKPLPDSMRTREPWPMWPIALAIVAFIGIYTWIQLEYRKEGPAFEPYQAMQDRKNAIAQKNFYEWYSLKSDRSTAPVEISAPAQSTSRAFPDVLDQVIPEQLKYYMSSRPVLLPGFVKTESPGELTPGQPLPLRLHVPAALVDNEQLQLLSFYKDGKLFILATLYVESLQKFDQSLLEGDTAPVNFLIPTGPIAAETIDVNFLNQDRLAEWQITNLDPSAAVVEEEEEEQPEN